MVLFECNLNAPLPVLKELQNATIERKNSQADINPNDLHRITTTWNEKTAKLLHEHRFRLGASLWLLKTDGKVAAYGWTVRERTVEPHFFPLGPADFHLFDFFVFPEYRGRRLNPTLVNHILTALVQEGASRAFIEAAEWNKAQLVSLSRTFFQKIGCARKFEILGKTIIIWSEKAQWDTTQE